MAYCTDRNYLLTENDIDFSKTERITPNNIFRNFLIKENVEKSKKYIRYKKTEVLPEYSNIRKKINNHITEIKNNFDIKNTIFKEIKSKDIIAYSKFAKNMKIIYFGPKGMITQKYPNLKKYYDTQEKKKIGLNTKIYAGRWEYFEDTSKTSRYLNRLKSNRKKMLKIGGHFSTEDDVAHRIHDLYLRKKKIDELAKIREEKKKEDMKKILENNKRRFSLVNDINKLNIFTKNIFEYTSVEPKYKRKKSLENYSNNKYKMNFTLPSVFKEKSKDSTFNDIDKDKDNTKNDDDISIIENVKRKNDLKKIKNIFKKEKLENKIYTEKKKHFKKLKSSIYTKLNSIIEPSKNLLKNINNIKINNKTNYSSVRNKNKEKYKEDIKVISEDYKKKNVDNMNEFVKTHYKEQLIQKKSNIPIKIHFSYYDRSKNNVHNELKNYITNLGRMKEEEKERKYHKNIRDQFINNCKIMEQLGMNIDALKIKGNL